MQILGLGTDIVECDRIQQMIDKHGDQFIDRVYTVHEIQYCRDRKSKLQHFSGRWAAKEAVFKALGTGWIRGLRWRDVEVFNQPSGEPTVRLAGNARRICEEKTIAQILITISHAKQYATATAIALGETSTSVDSMI